MVSYEFILNRITEAEFILRADKKFNAETYIEAVSKILDSSSLKYTAITTKENCYDLSIYVDDQNLSNWVFEKTREIKND